MRADICDADDAKGVERFRAALRMVGATLAEKDWAIGVEVSRLEVDGEELTVFSDAYSIDVEGPDDLVKRILKAYNACTQ